MEGAFLFSKEAIFHSFLRVKYIFANKIGYTYE